jgi:Flp pilus assembly protein TadB
MDAAKPIPDTTSLLVRRGREQRRRRLLRLDIGFGLLAAVAALVIAPGLAVAALLALLVLGVCLLSLAVGRWRSRRR